MVEVSSISLFLARKTHMFFGVYKALRKSEVQLERGLKRFKCTNCSCRGPAFDSHPPQGSSQLYIIPVYVDPIPLLTSELCRLLDEGGAQTYVYLGHTNIYIKLTR